MNELKNILEQNLNDNFISAVLSNPRDEKLSAKVKVRPVLMKDTRVYQMETFRGNQAFHENLSADEACEKMLEAMENMKQMQLVTADAEFSVLISKKGKVTIKKKQKKAKMRPLDLNHNRKKQYILQEGVPVPFLQDLGVMTEEGKIVHARFDKFRQINRFLEFIEDILPQLDSGREHPRMRDISSRDTDTGETARRKRGALNEMEKSRDSRRGTGSGISCCGGHIWLCDK